MSEADWGKRALELFGSLPPAKIEGAHTWVAQNTAIIAALKLGHEMAAAAHHAEAAVWSKVMGEVEQQWRERRRFMEEAHVKELAKQKIQAENGRAEEIGIELEKRMQAEPRGTIRCLWADAARIARSTIAKPKTREQVLEDALRKSGAECSCGWKVDAADQHADYCTVTISRRALEWKP